MDSIVKRLSEIEAAAAAIVDHAEGQKEILDKEYEEKRRRFDEKLEGKTQAKLRRIRDELENKTKQILASQSGSNSASIRALQKEYEEKHTTYAQDILRRMTEV